MTDNDYLQLALELAQRAGADAADAVLIRRESLELGWRLGALEELERKESLDLGVRVLVGGRVATASTNRLDHATLATLVEDAVASARLLPEDPWAGLPDLAEIAMDTDDLDLVDPDEPSIEELRRAAAEAEDAARAVPGVTNSNGASASWARTRFSLAANSGFSGSFARTRHSLGVTVLAGTGTGMQRDHEYRWATHRADLPAAELIGRLAGERAVRRLDPRKVPSGTVPVLYEPRAAAGLLRHLAGAISGEAIAAGRSFLKEGLGQPVFAAGIDILDEPFRPRGLASRPFDGEGIRAVSRKLVDDGVLTTWLLDTASARRLKLASTGHASRGGASLGSPSPTNLVLAAGKVAPTELMADIREGFLVTEMMGMGVSTVTGDYSRGASGFWIEQGEIAYPVSEVTVAGNLRDMFRRLIPAADLEIKGSTDAPTVRIDGLTVAGK